MQWKAAGSLFSLEKLYLYILALCADMRFQAGFGRCCRTMALAEYAAVNAVSFLKSLINGWRKSYPVFGIVRHFWDESQLRPKWEISNDTTYIWLKNKRLGGKPGTAINKEMTGTMPRLQTCSFDRWKLWYGITNHNDLMSRAFLSYVE